MKNKTHITNAWKHIYRKQGVKGVNRNLKFDNHPSSINKHILNNRNKESLKKNAIRPSLWQFECAEFCRMHKQMVIHSVTGSGKSLAVRMIIREHLNSTPSAKALVVVPQNMIAGNFGEDDIIIDEEVITLEAKVLCLEKGIDSTVKSLRSFLKRKIKSKNNIRHSNRIMVCTHQTLQIMFRGCKTKKEKIELFKDVMLWIDEAHHVQTKQIGIEKYELNGLGKVVEFMAENNFHVGLTTATMFRGDGDLILKPEIMEKFKTYSLSFDRYIEERCDYLREISYNWAMFEDEYFDAIKAIYKEDPYQRSIIYIPSIGSIYSRSKIGLSNQERNKTKEEEVWDIIRSICPKFDPKRDRKKNEEFNCYYYEVNVNGKFLVVVDMTKARGRKNLMRFIQSENKKENPLIDIIITLKLFMEGADYVPLQRCIIVDKRESLVSLTQMPGRVFRDYTDKHFASVYHILPTIIKARYENHEFKEILNSYVSQYVNCILLQNFTTPSKISTKRENYNSTGNELNRNKIWIEVLGGRSRAVIASIASDFIMLKPIESDNNHYAEISLVNQLVNKYLKQEGITDEDTIQKMAIALRRMMGKMGVCNDWSNHNNLDLMDEDGVLGGLCSFTSKVMGHKKLSEIRKSINGSRYSPIDLVDVVAEFIKEFGTAPTINTARNDIEMASVRFLSSIKSSEKEIESFLARESESVDVES